MPIEDSARGTVPRWNDILALTRRAGRRAASVWIPDHLIVQMPFPGEFPSGSWEAWSLAAALAAATDRITIGLLVSCTAFRNPALQAKMADTVDEISNGRLILGLGAGWCELEFRAFGYPFDHRVGRFEEALTIVAGLLRNGSMDYQGTYYQVRDCELRPRGPRPQGPPILVGSSSTGKRMLRLAARHADIWNRDFDAVNPGVTPYSAADLTASQTRVDAACAEIGRDPATLARTAGCGSICQTPHRVMVGAAWRDRRRRSPRDSVSTPTPATASSGLAEPIDDRGDQAFAPVITKVMG